MLEFAVGLIVGLVGWALKHFWDTKHYRLALRENVENWTERVRDWSERVIECLNQAHYEFNVSDVEPLPHERAQARQELALRLYTLVEQGRLYFPNENRSLYGQSKQAARQGYRSAVLDPLVATVKLLRGESEPNFDFPGSIEKYGQNRYARAVRLYSDAFLSFAEVIVAVREGNRRRVDLLRKVGSAHEAKRLERLLCPSDATPPPGHRYWLGLEKDLMVPNVEDVLEGRWQ